MGAQLVAGPAWGTVMLAAFGGVLALGRTGREGLSGGLFSMLAFAAAIRIGTVTLQLNTDATVRALLAWLPGIAWIAVALVIAVALSRVPRRAAAA